MLLRRFAYRCRVCDLVYYDASAPPVYLESSRNEYRLLSSALLGLSDVRSTSLSTHPCKDGSLGIGDLIGIKSFPSD